MEAKSGYGLEPDEEMRILDVMARALSPEHGRLANEVDSAPAAK